MAKDILLGAFYQDSTGLGVTALTVTIDVWRVAHADLTKSEIVTAGAVTEIGDGVYAYRVAAADLQTYYYFGVCKTAGTVAQKHVAAVQLDYADSPGLVTLIWNSLTSGLTTAGSIGKRLVDYLTGDVYARLGAPTNASIAADVAAVQADTDNLQTRIPAALVGGKIDAVTTAADVTLAASQPNYAPAKAGDAMTLTAGERNSIADALLKRDWTAVTGEASRSVLQALRFLRNKWQLTGTTLSVKAEDDTTEAWSATVTTQSGAEPITGTDPT